ncbi:MAG: replication initiator [Gaiellaceae bacterium]
MTPGEDAVRQLRRASGCADPIRLRGWLERIDPTTGEILARVVTAREPTGALLVPCGDRRTANCPSCAETYRRDAFQLVASGLRGGKGVPKSVASHPVVMATLTAPSFGLVHTIRDRGGGCPCGRRHSSDDEVLGTPVDPTTYRYEEQAAWNHLAPTLWKRTAQAIRRKLARELGVPRDRLSELLRVRFVMASEFQRRGVVHYHVVIRIDGPGDAGSEPPSRCTAEMFERVVRSVVSDVELPAPPVRSRECPIRWGRQAEIVGLDLSGVGRAAGYIAKYATKATEGVAGGTLIPRVRTRREVASMRLPPHARRLVEAAWRAGETRGLEGAQRWAHQFGYGGHTLTKSRDYSVTFAVLRATRAAWRAGRPTISWTSAIARGTLVFAGRGYANPAADWLARECWSNGAKRSPRNQSGERHGGST